jgi:muramoyltetrapeptide carboxypeptidase
MRSPERTSIIPEMPKAGDTIGIIAPASSFDREKFFRGCERLRALGYKIFFHESIFEKDSYFAGTHERRAWELHQMFEKRFVKAIFCARGGYGSNHLLPLLNIDLITANPKMLMGYSDMTSLLTYIHDRTGLATYHGPMVAKDFAETETEIDFTSVLNVNVTGAQISPGTCGGKLYGGCLSMLTASLGTPYEVHTKGTVLFIEDVATKPYQIDRMLMQLKLAGKLEEVRGIVFGEMTDCFHPGTDENLLKTAVRDVLRDFDGPIGWGVRSGHLSDYRVPGVTLPLGAEVTLTVKDNSVTLAQVSSSASSAQ